MSKDNENTLSKEFSKLADHFLPDNMLIKGIETLGKMKGDVILLDNALRELANSSDLTASQLKNVTEEASDWAMLLEKVELKSFLTSILPKKLVMTLNNP